MTILMKEFFSITITPHYMNPGRRKLIPYEEDISEI